MEILAKLSALEFYRQQPELREGAYEVVEHDGEISIAVVKARNLAKWYDQAEWVEYQEELKRELDFEPIWDSLLDDPNDGMDLLEAHEYLDRQFDPEHAKALELSDDDCNDCAACSDCCKPLDPNMRLHFDSTLVDETPLKNKYPESTKTLADLLREQLSLGKSND